MPFTVRVNRPVQDPDDHMATTLDLDTLLHAVAMLGPLLTLGESLIITPQPQP